MLINIILPIAVLVLGILNFVHWCLRGNRLLYWPTGTLGALVNGLAVALPIVAVLALARVVSDALFSYIVSTYAVIASVYSIGRRRRIPVNPAVVA